MRRAVTIVLAFALLSGIVVAFTRQGTPARASVLAAQNGEICAPEEIARGENEIVETPPDAAGIGRLSHEPGWMLYSVLVTLPPGTCVAYHSHEGAVSLVVHEGVVEYAYTPIAPASTPEILGADASNASIEIAAGEPVILEPGSWVTQDQEVNYTYRNVGPDNAVVALAAYVRLDNFEDQDTDGDDAAVLTDTPAFSAVPVAQGTPAATFFVPDWGPVPGCTSGCKKRSSS